MRLLPGRSGIACRAALVPGGRTLFLQVDDGPDPVTALVLRHRSAPEVTLPVEHRSFDPAGTATAQTPDVSALHATGSWTVAARLADGRERPVDWDGSGPAEDVTLLSPPDPTSGWTVTPGRDRRGRLVLEAAAAPPAAHLDHVDVGSTAIRLAGRVVGSGAAARHLAVTSDDGRSIQLAVTGAPAGWTAGVGAADLPTGALPMRWAVRLQLSDGSTVPVGRPLSGLTALPQVYRYPWAADASGGIEVRPQYTYSRRLELHQRAGQAAR